MGGDVGPERAAGFTLVELLIAVIVLGILASLAFGGWRRYADSTAADRAARVLMGDIALTRSFAIQRRETVSLVIDEADRTYQIRAPGGPLLAQQDFGAGSDTPLTAMDIQSADSVVFNARGFLTTGPLQVDLTRYDAERRVSVSGLGRTRVTTP